MDSIQGNWTGWHDLEKDYKIQKNALHWALTFSFIWVKEKQRKMRRLKRRGKRGEVET